VKTMESPISFIELTPCGTLMETQTTTMVWFLFSLCYKHLQKNKRVVHLHFALTREVLYKILADFPSPTELVETFFDTESRDLARSNIWLKKVGERYSLKKFAKDLEMGLEYWEQSYSSLEEALKEASSDLEFKLLEVKPFISLPVLRYKRSYNEVLVQFDIATLGPEDFYCVGVFEVTSSLLEIPCIPWISNVKIPVRSKIMEYFSSYEPKIYQQLEKLGLVTDDYFCSYELNHHWARPFQEKTPKEPSAEDLIEIDRYFELLKTSPKAREEHKRLAHSFGDNLLEYLKEHYEHMKELNLLC